MFMCFMYMHILGHTNIILSNQIVTIIKKYVRVIINGYIILVYATFIEIKIYDIKDIYIKIES